MLASTQPRRPAAGLYKGSGVAPGGQVGRLRSITHGVGGAKAGRVPAGSALGHRAIGGSVTRAPAPLRSVGTTVRPVLGQPNPDRYVAPTAVPVPQGVADPSDPTGLLHDSAYYNEIGGYQRSYSDQSAPLNAERASLLAVDPVTGRNIYDNLYSRAQGKFGRNVLSERDQMSNQGLLRSGANDMALGDMSNDWMQQQSDLFNQYGQGRINNIDTSLKQAQASFDEQKRLAALEAAARAQERMWSANASIYDTGA